MFDPSERCAEPRSSWIIIGICVVSKLLFISRKEIGLEAFGLTVSQYVIVSLGNSGAVVTWSIFRLPNDVGNKTVPSEDFVAKNFEIVHLIVIDGYPKRTVD